MRSKTVPLLILLIFSAVLAVASSMGLINKTLPREDVSDQLACDHLFRSALPVINAQDNQWAADALLSHINTLSRSTAKSDRKALDSALSPFIKELESGDISRKSIANIGYIFEEYNVNTY